MIDVWQGHKYAFESSVFILGFERVFTRMVIFYNLQLLHKETNIASHKELSSRSALFYRKTDLKDFLKFT